MCSSMFQLFKPLVTMPPGMQASIIRCLSHVRINCEGCSRKDIQRKWGMMEVRAPIVQMGWCTDRLMVRLPLLSFPAP